MRSGLGASHRFAGSGDRAALAGLVYDALRRRASSIHVMGDPGPRAVLLGMLRLERKLEPDAIAALANGGRFAPQPLSPDELARLAAPGSRAVRRPGWPAITRNGSIRISPACSATSAPPRARRLRAGRRLICASTTSRAIATTATALLADLNPVPTRWSPFGLRIALEADAKNPAIHAEPAFIKGMVEVQDEGSQLAALLAGAKPGEHVVDLCAGAGGKTLALAAAMHNQGQLYATDTDKRRLAPIHERLARSGARNVQVRTPKSVGTELADLAGRADLVLIDAPCTGIGTWRRNPDAKWRVRPGALAVRLKEQAAVLDRAAGLVKPGGRIAYVTCSVLAEENGDQIQAFLARETGFSARAPGRSGERARRARLSLPPCRADVGRGIADDPAPHRHRWILRLGAGADLMA